MRVYGRLTRLLARHWRWLALGVLASAVTLAANVALMALSGWFLAAMAVAGVAGVSMNYFTPAAMIRGLAIVRTAGRYVERLVTHEATFRLIAELRTWFYTRLEPLAPARLAGHHSAELLSRIGADMDVLEHFYLRVVVPFLVAGLAGGGVVLFVGQHSPAFALALAALLLVAGVVVPVIVGRLGAAPGAATVARSAELRTAVVDGVQGLTDLTMFGAAEAQAQQVVRLGDELAEAQRRLSGLTGLSQAALLLCANLAMVAALLLVVPLVRAGTLDGPLLAMLVLLGLATFEAVMPLPQALIFLGRTTAAARRIFSLVDAAPAVAEPAAPAPLPAQPAFRLEQVTFRYRPEGPPVLAELDLDLTPGRKVALVGPTGSGKSSVIGLLARFYAPEAGSIALGGRPLADYSGEDVRSLLAVVPQQVHLFNTTVAGNLRLGRPDADGAALAAVAETALLSDVVAALPEGFDTYVGEAGVKLSGGQARRVAIARALLKEAPVLVLDEPGEGLDLATEARLLERLLAASAERAVLLITHRAAGLARMDEILVLEAGRVADRGTHGELLARNAYYGRLHAVLAEGEAETAVAG